jgi:hypothetical protein
MHMIMDLKTDSWSYDISDLDGYSDYIDFYFSFKKEESTEIEFNNLSFGYFVVVEGNEIVNEEYPKDNSKYIYTDQAYLEVSRVFGFRPNRSYYIEFWAEEDGVRFFNSVEFEMPLPPQPYPSWTWGDEEIQWIPPFPPPNDGNLYAWNEATQSWERRVIQ